MLHFIECACRIFVAWPAVEFVVGLIGKSMGEFLKKDSASKVSVKYW